MAGANDIICRKVGPYGPLPLLCAMLFLLMGLAAVPADSHAQTRGKIAGTITDAATGETIPGANVVIQETMRGTTSDREGYYFIANVETGTYSVRASFIGYQPVTVTNVEVQPGQTTEVDFELAQATVEMDEEVVVTAERPLIEKDVTASVTRLQTREVTEQPTTDFTDVLTTLPSINRENGEVTVRGGDLSGVAFMIDGARAGNPLTQIPYTRVNIGAIQEVQVITGAFNAEYGEAMSGVVNVVTKEGGDEYEGYINTRYEPPGIKHWGNSLYDRSTPLYWENTHARHLEWWVENQDQWVDPNGLYGTHPQSEWTPEEAYQNYLDTHQPPTNYGEIPSWEISGGVGGPVPYLDGFSFFTTLDYRSSAPLIGNAFRERGTFIDGTAKLTYQMGGGKKLMLSGFYGEDETGFGHGDYPPFFWGLDYGVDARYAYYDFEGLEYSSTNGQTFRYSHVLNEASLYEVQLSRVQAIRETGVLPGDPIGWEAAAPTEDRLRAVDSTGSPIPGGFSNAIGYHTTGYYYRYNDDNIEWKLESFFSSQLNKYVQMETGFDFNYYRLDHFNESKLPARVDSALYNPYQGALYAQSKVEYGGLILNGGLRLDFYNPNDSVYQDLFSPLDGAKAETGTYFQLSPRLGISHPINTETVLHFAYGHFFQRPPFNEYGEGSDDVRGNLNTFIVRDQNIPWVLGNRNLEPRKVVSYEVGIERSFWDVLKLDLTGYYKDIRNTIRTITIETPDGIYRTNGNGDYQDVRGVEVSLRKVPRTYSWGAFWGYLNYSKRFSILGRSGDPVVISPDGARFAPSGDFIVHHNPYLKAGLYYSTPATWSGVLGTLFRNVSMSLDYRATFPNDQIPSDFFFFDGEQHMRSVDQNSDLRIQKIVAAGGVEISPYVEVHNLFNDRWIYFGALERASEADQRQFVESDFEVLPTHTASGTPILDMAKFRNLPRSVTFGMKVRF